MRGRGNPPQQMAPHKRDMAAVHYPDTGEARARMYKAWSLQKKRSRWPEPIGFMTSYGLTPLTVRFQKTAVVRVPIVRA